MPLEVEKKYTLTPETKQSLLQSAESFGTKVFTDVYYDTPTYDLTTKDTWLRSRDGRWELKVPLADFLTRTTDQYRELETEADIAEHLHLSRAVPFAEALAQGGYAPFASLTTTRTKYRKDGFTIDLDSMDFGYEIAEIECIAPSESAIPTTVDAILRFAESCGLQNLRTGQVRGKVIEYLLRKSKPHFDALVRAGVALPEDSI